MKENKVDVFEERDVLGHVKDDSVNNAKNAQKDNIDYSEIFEFPTIKTRYFTLLIDLIFIILISLGISYFFEQVGNVHDYFRGISFIMVLVLYEPILISLACTPGQLWNGIRVRQFKHPEKRISFFNAVFRIVCKSLLGWLSFITITLNKNRRAIHDFASGSIVLELNNEKTPAVNKELR